MYLKKLIFNEIRMLKGKVLEEEYIIKENIKRVIDVKGEIQEVYSI